MISMIGFKEITVWIHQSLSGLMSPGMVVASEALIVGLSMIMLVVLMAVAMIYMERKVAGFMQLRLGPMRVGLWGSMQAFADVLKLLLKECLTPNGADKLLFGLAPFIVLVVSFMALAPFSFAPGLQMWDLNIGVLVSLQKVLSIPHP